MITVHDIAVELGVSYRTTTRYIEQLGIKHQRVSVEGAKHKIASLTKEDYERLMAAKERNFKPEGHKVNPQVLSNAFLIMPLRGLS